MNEIFDPKFEYFKSLDLNAVKRCEHSPPWVPERGRIYSPPQTEIQENDADNKDKVKLTPEDEVPFPDFCALEDHQRDIIKILTVRRRSGNHVSVVAGADGNGRDGGGGGGGGGAGRNGGGGNGAGGAPDASGGCCAVG